MTLRRGTTGSGLTEKATLRWDLNEDRENPEVVSALEAAGLDGLIASIERACRGPLLDAGLPSSHGCYAYKTSGEWKPWADEDWLAGWGIANTVEPLAQAKGIAKDSPAGLAAAMMDRVHWIRDNQARGDHARAALFAYYLGVLRAESRIKLEHERVWITGKTIHKAGKDSRKGRSQAERVTAVNALCNGPAPIKKTAAFAIIAEQEGVTAKAIEADYYSPRKRPKRGD
ncbi:hypothetical protein [Brevundimonas subvibrioides]|uniref:hypothetical protein n=1 Tax=Brevundimonas subvibrioides TaxID=74313 RepID=UPI0022B45B5C|nr:hypothetical protein [Brevundimonas subvibrioides]